MFTNRSAHLTRSDSLSSASTPDVRGRLSFSSPLLTATKMPRPSLATPSPIVNNRRLVDYHMSQQNPAVLDDMYNNASSSSPGHPLYNTLSQHRFSNTPPVGSIPLVRSGKSNSIVMASLMKQSLNNNFRHSVGSTGSSLVQLATAKPERVRNGFPSVSPVIVKLSSRDRNKGERHKEGWFDDEDDHCNKAPVNPCDRDVVVSALKLKCRKRWNSSIFEDDDDNSSLSYNNLPMAKRPKSGGDGLVRKSSPVVSSVPVSCPRPSSCPLPQPLPAGFVKPNPIPGRRKHVCEQNGNLPAVPDEHEAKRVKVAQPISRVLRSATQESHRDGVSTTAPVPMASDSDRQHSEKKRERERSSTPLVEDEEDEPESVGNVRNKRVKRESTIKLQASLSQVFPSRSTPGAPARKKLPVLCSTGTPPDLPTDFSNKAVPVTGKELKRDRQVRIERMRRYLSQDDDESDGSSENQLGLKSWSVPTPSATSSVTLMQKSKSSPAATASVSTALGSGGVLQLGQTTSASSTTAAGLGLLSTLPPPSFPSSSSSSSSSVPTSSSEGSSSGLKLPVLATTAAPAVTSTCSSLGLKVGLGGGLQLGSLSSTQLGSSSLLQPSLPSQSFSFPPSTGSSSELTSLSTSSSATGSTSPSNETATLTVVSSLSTDAAPSSLGGGSDGVSSTIGVPSSLKPSESVSLLNAAPNLLQAKGGTELTAAPTLGSIQTASQQTGLGMPSFLSSTAGASAPSSSLSLGFPSSGGSLSVGSSLKAGAKEMQPPLPGQLGLNLFPAVTQQNATVSNMHGTQAPPSSNATQPGFSFSVSKSTTLPSLSSSGTASFGSQQQQPLSVTQASLFSGQPSQTGASSIGMKLNQLNNNASFKLATSDGPAQPQTQPAGSGSTLLGGVSAPSFFSQMQQATGGGSSNLFQLSAASSQNVTGQQPKQGGFQLGGAAKLSSGFPSNPTGGMLASSQSSQAQQQGQTSSPFSGAGAAPSSSSSTAAVFGAGGLGMNASLAFGASTSQLGAVSSSGPFGNQGSVAPSQGGGGSGGLFGAGGQLGTATPSLQFGAPTGQAQQPALGSSSLFQFSADSSQQKQQPAAAATPSLQLGQGTFGQNQQQLSGGLKQMNNSNVFGTQSMPSTFNFSAGGGATSQTPALGDGKLNFGAGAPGIGGMAGMGSIQQPAQNSGMSGFSFSGMGQPQQQSQAPSFNFSAMAGAQEQSQAPSFDFSGMGAAQQNTASSFNFSITGSQQQQGASNTGFNFSAVASNAGFQQPNAMGGTAFGFAGSQPISSSGAVNFSLGKSRTASNRPRGRRRK